MLFIGFILSVTSIGLLLAQGTCPAIVEQALLSMGENCDDLERNSVCYGYNLVSDEFTETVSDDFFTQPSDTSALGILETIRTSEMNETTEQWGVAVMSLQANIPNSIPGQSVKFVLLGDVEVESAVEPDSVFQSVDAISVTMANNANIRSGASLTFNVIDGVDLGDTLLVDGQSADGNWFRTVIGSRIGWVFGDLIEDDDNLLSLPVIDGTQRTLMQSFYLRTGFGTPACEEAPEDTLMIQGPDGIEIDLTVNGADIRVGSTIALRILPPGDLMEITVIDGKVVVPGAGPDGGDLIIYENQRTTAFLSDPDDRGIDGNNNDRIVECGESSWTEPESVSDTILGEAFCVLEDVPEDLLNYSIDLECPSEDPVEPTSTNTVDAPSGSTSESQDPIETQEPSVTQDPAETEEPAQDDNNLCSEGNAWDDGRCTSDYWWEAGFYFGEVEAGIITLDDVPSQFKPSPTATPTPEPEEQKSNPIDARLYCEDGTTFVEVSKAPTGDTSATIDYFDTYTGMAGSTVISIPGSDVVGSFTVENVKVTTSPSGKTKNLGDIDCT